MVTVEENNMAKLSAHGTVVAKVKSQFALNSDVNATQVVHVKVLMSDGVILEKHTFLRSDNSKNYGTWKKVGPVKDLYRSTEAWLALQFKMGFEREAE
jgi:hypothetical protein